MNQPALSLSDLEACFFRTLNTVTTPLIERGFGSTSLLPSGLTILETIGRKSARRLRTPLHAVFFPGGALVGTYRAQRSGWMKNLKARPDVRYWLDGRPREASAEVYPGSAGWAFAVLRDRKDSSTTSPRGDNL